MSGFVGFHSERMFSQPLLSIWLFGRTSSFEELLDQSSWFFIDLVVKTILEENDFLYPLDNFFYIFCDLESPDHTQHKMLASYMLALAVQLTDTFYRPNESQDEFAERLRNLHPETVQKLLELRTQVDLKRILMLIIDLKASFREKAEGIEEVFNVKSLEILKESKKFIPFLYATCDFCGREIEQEVNKDTWRECAACKGSTLQLITQLQEAARSSETSSSSF